jgi:hypothetical protein
MDALSLLLIALIGVAAFAFGYLAGRNRRKGIPHG